MALYKRKGIYYYRFEFRGIEIRKSTGCGDRDSAKKMEAVAKSALYKGEVGILDKRSSVPTLVEFQERFTEYISAHRADHPETIRYYKSKYKALLSYGPFSSTSIDRIDDEMIGRFTLKQLGLQKARATVNHYLRTLKRALRLAKRWKIVRDVPYIEMLDNENRREYVLPRDEQAKFLDACPPFLRNIVEFDLETGLRRKELLNLQWKDISMQAKGIAALGTITVRGTKSKTSHRIIPLTKTAHEVLQRQHKISKCDYVFVREKNASRPIPEGSIGYVLSNVRSNLGMNEEFVLHSLRHTFATRLGEAGVGAFTIMRIMGHSSIATSQRYVHPTAGEVESAFIALSA